MKNIIFPILIVLSIIACQSEHYTTSEVLSELKDGDGVDRTFFFYPGIMRAVNLKDNPDYYQLIRNVRKLVVYRMKDEFGVDDVVDLKLRLQAEEHFEEYATVNLNGRRIYFLGKEDPNQSILMVPTKYEYYLADIVGQINIWSLNQLIQTLSADSTSIGEDFLDVFSLVGIQREEDDATKDSISVDSLNQDTLSKVIIEE
ncbi:MAG: hypothetical protein IPL46_28840 [Saprospiraceae bacterium]|nr:hypothetical protein [Saprospiraceae bacterium]